MKKYNKILIVLLLVLTIGLVGLTIAYFSNSTSLDNIFKSKDYGTTYTEEFVSPDNWLPGDVTEKSITATNTGSIDQAIRISYTESWTPNKSGETLSGWIHPDGTKSNHTAASELETDEKVAVIKLANTSDWSYEGGYWYYNYRLSPGESTTSLIESVTFNPNTKLDDTCTTTLGEGTKTITCNSSGSDYDHATYNLTFTIESVQYEGYASAWQLPNNTSIAIANSSKPEPEEPETPVVTPSGAEYLASNATNAANAEYNADTKGKMFTFTHGEGANAVTESRYIGDAPNNYVYFNCTDDNDTSTCEVWRIIGTFDVERSDPEHEGQTITETRMKLVRGYDFATTMQWDNRDTSSEGGWSGSGKNDWNGSVMNTYLNGTYYSSLSATAQSQIEEAIYYLGGRAYDSTSHYGSTEDIYAWERGTVTYNNSRPTSWEGKVALMYPSDMYMTYANGVEDNCYNDPYKCYTSATPAADPTQSWVHNTNKLEGSNSQLWTWFLSPNSGYSFSVFLASVGCLGNDNANTTVGGRPVVYLKSDIKITEGTGEESSPFKLGL